MLCLHRYILIVAGIHLKKFRNPSNNLRALSSPDLMSLNLRLSICNDKSLSTVRWIHDLKRLANPERHISRETKLLKIFDTRQTPATQVRDIHTSTCPKNMFTFFWKEIHIFGPRWSVNCLSVHNHIHRQSMKYLTRVNYESNNSSATSTIPHKYLSKRYVHPFYFKKKTYIWLKLKCEVSITIFKGKASNKSRLWVQV